MTRGLKQSTPITSTSSSTTTPTSPLSATAPPLLLVEAETEAEEQEEEASEKNCPPSITLLGRSSWTLLHSVAASYPTHPSATKQTEMTTFLTLFARLYPCWTCAEDFQAWIATDRPDVGSRRGLGLWLCRAHNGVNRKLGKAEFDCRGWERRWRTGGEGC